MKGTTIIFGGQVCLQLLVGKYPVNYIQLLAPFLSKFQIVKYWENSQIQKFQQTLNFKLWIDYKYIHKM